MLRRYLKVIKKYLRNKKLNLSQENGFSLVEVIVAFFIMSIITVVLVRGTMIAVDTIKVNKAKTKALAVASEKMELIRAMDYEGIELTSVNPDWGVDNPALIEDGYDISYEVSEVYVSGSSYKQVKLSILKDPMNTGINVITQIYPMAGGGEGTNDTTPPAAPSMLEATATGSSSIDLDWDDNAEADLAGYKVYRDTVSGFIPESSNFIGDATSSSYSDTGLTATTTYYYRVTAVDISSNESEPSMQADATTLLEYAYISLPFAYTGAGEYYWKSDEFSTDPVDWASYVNSWSLDILEINGVNYTNKWKAQHDIPPAGDGYWYIYYKATSSGGHLEIGP